MMVDQNAPAPITECTLDEGIVPALDTAEKDARSARSQANASASVTAPAVGDTGKGKGSNLDPF
jgi:hypothetical protein